MVPSYKSDWRYYEIRAMLWAWTDYRCWYCGTVARPGDRRLDHLAGPSLEWAHLRPICLACQRRKWRMSTDEFRVFCQRDQFWGELNVVFPPIAFAGHHPKDYPRFHPVATPFVDAMFSFDQDYFFSRPKHRLEAAISSRSNPNEVRE